MIPMRPTSSMSNGPARTFPPAAFAFSAVSSTFSTSTWLSQCGGGAPSIALLKPPWVFPPTEIIS